MSANDQADGFFGDDRAYAKCNHPDCAHLSECAVPLRSNENSGRGTKFEQPHDVQRQMQYPLGMLLARGFSILSGSKHDL